jgi:hypothetical protein
LLLIDLFETPRSAIWVLFQRAFEPRSFPFNNDTTRIQTSITMAPVYTDYPSMEQDNAHLDEVDIRGGGSATTPATITDRYFDSTNNDNGNSTRNKRCRRRRTGGCWTKRPHSSFPATGEEGNSLLTHLNES